MSAVPNILRESLLAGSAENIFHTFPEIQEEFPQATQGKLTTASNPDLLLWVDPKNNVIAKGHHNCLTCRYREYNSEGLQICKKTGRILTQPIISELDTSSCPLQENRYPWSYPHYEEIAEKLQEGTYLVRPDGTIQEIDAVETHHQIASKA